MLIGWDVTCGLVEINFAIFTLWGKWMMNCLSFVILIYSFCHSFVLNKRNDGQWQKLYSLRLWSRHLPNTLSKFKRAQAKLFRWFASFSHNPKRKLDSFVSNTCTGFSITSYKYYCIVQCQMKFRKTYWRPLIHITQWKCILCFLADVAISDSNRATDDSQMLSSFELPNWFFHQNNNELNLILPNRSHATRIKRKKSWTGSSLYWARKFQPVNTKTSWRMASFCVNWPTNWHPVR